MNKNVSLGINVVLAIAVAVLYYLHFKSPSTTATASDSSSDSTVTIEVTPSEVKNSKIVFVNTDSLLANYAFVKKAKADLESRGKRVESQVLNQQNDLQKQVQAYQEKGSKGLLTAEEMQNTEGHLMKQRDDLLAYREREMGKLMEEEKRIDDQLFKTVNAFMKRYCEKTHYQFVLSKTGGAGLLFADDSLDITKDVLEGLNKEYKGK